MYNGCEMCNVTFMFIFGIGKKHKINPIQKHYLNEGLATRMHKYLTLRPHNYNNHYQLIA